MNIARRRLFLSSFSFLGGTFLLLAFSLQDQASAQVPGDKPAASTTMMRPCAVHPAGSKSRKSKAKGEAGATSKEFALACIEAQGSPLDIQEFLQSYVRAQGWRFGEERIVADGWMFARYLDKQELLQFAKEGRYAGRVTWTEGKALVLVTTRELEDDFTRVEVTARIHGFGQNVDRFAPAKDSWELDSTGLLEKNLITALQDHFKSIR